MRSPVGNFICTLKGPARDEAVDLLGKMYTAVVRVGFNITDSSLINLLGSRPIKGLPGVFEMKGRHVRIYFRHRGRSLEVLMGGPKATQEKDIARLRRMI